eukprot:6179712-Pleurochrysis_carterae.AAC.1
MPYASARTASHCAAYLCAARLQNARSIRMPHARSHTLTLSLLPLSLPPSLPPSSLPLSLSFTASGRAEEGHAVPISATELVLDATDGSVASVVTGGISPPSSTARPLLIVVEDPARDADELDHTLAAPALVELVTDAAMGVVSANVLRAGFGLAAASGGGGGAPACPITEAQKTGGQKIGINGLDSNLHFNGRKYFGYVNVK